MKCLSRLYRPELITFGLFFSIAVIIVILHLLFHPFRVLGMDTSIFYMDEKYTLAAFFLTITAFLVGYLTLTNLTKIQKNIKWFASVVYGLFFVGLALDEYFEIHEYANTLVKAVITTDGPAKTLANLSWIFPLSFIILAVFILLIVKIKHSTANIRLPMILGGLSFVVVLIFELLGAATYGQDIYVYFVAIEEGMEMIGASFFLLAALLDRRISTKNSPR